MGLLGALFISPLTSFAQSSQTWTDLYQTEIMLGIVGLLLLIILVVLVVLYFVLRTVLYKMLEEKGVEFESGWSRFLQNMTQAVPIEQEEGIVKHEYDGILELDNKLPPWWVAMFYVTIVFGVGYLVYYHMMDGPTSEEEYIAQMEAAEEEVSAYLASLEEVIDETNVYVLQDEARLLAGKDFFETNCGTCHGKEGQGLPGLGPNLTDDYWLHGGDVKSMFTTVKYGIKATSMIAWGKNLSPSEMHNVVSYAYTLYGTNPDNPRDAEGELFTRNPADDYGDGYMEEEQETPADSTQEDGPQMAALH